jgi:mono/diheme cytochrome c family protein
MRSTRGTEIGSGRAGLRSLALFVVAAVVVGCGEGQKGTDANQGAASGEPIYAVRCAPCHGADGGGDGPAAAGLQPKPRNFHDPDFWRGRTTEQLRLVVQHGKPGTLMPPFEGTLSPEQIDAVVAYLQSFRSRGS